MGQLSGSVECIVAPVCPSSVWMLTAVGMTACTLTRNCLVCGTQGACCLQGCAEPQGPGEGAAAVCTRLHAAGLDQAGAVRDISCNKRALRQLI